ncbi:thiamine phosphate synthase [Labrys monachus]|uniref:Thiamine-phosphate pyrophosphorylase n=1 Tax=Labrys monachus TaxID=217067 RepID=A0ABU0F8C8_9HYPH|nr:thiamine phosphate synthase [Labrys monachus]MDQ0390865.1 thiamine-phosphate pyrophosphorylase [Labrys monachus]
MAEAANRPPVQIYLVTPAVADTAAFLPPLRAALGAGEVACVLFTPSASDDQSAKKLVKEIAPVVQAGGAALVVSGWNAIIARAGADGVHLIDGSKGVAEALESFKPERIVGVGGIRTRHEAMTAAEAGVDYVMFGEPAKDGRLPPLEAIVERTAWWAELFEIPCVAFAPDLAAVPLLADAGADFVALGNAVWEHDKGPAEAIALVDRLLKQRASV